MTSAAHERRPPLGDVALALTVSSSSRAFANAAASPCSQVLITKASHPQPWPPAGAFVVRRTVDLFSPRARQARQAPRQAPGYGLPPPVRQGPASGPRLPG